MDTDKDTTQDNPMDNIEAARSRVLAGNIRDLIPEASYAVQRQLGYGFTNLHGQDGDVVNTFEVSPFKINGGVGEDNSLPRAAGTGIYDKPITLSSYREYNPIEDAPREDAILRRFGIGLGAAASGSVTMSAYEAINKPYFAPDYNFDYAARVEAMEKIKKSGYSVNEDFWERAMTSKSPEEFAWYAEQLQNTANEGKAIAANKSAMVGAAIVMIGEGVVYQNYGTPIISLTGRAIANGVNATKLVNVANVTNKAISVMAKSKVGRVTYTVLDTFRGNSGSALEGVLATVGNNESTGDNEGTFAFNLFGAKLGRKLTPRVDVPSAQLALPNLNKDQLKLEFKKQLPTVYESPTGTKQTIRQNGRTLDLSGIHMPSLGMWYDPETDTWRKLLQQDFPRLPDFDSRPTDYKPDWIFGNGAVDELADELPYTAYKPNWTVPEGGRDNVDVTDFFDHKGFVHGGTQLGETDFSEAELKSLKKSVTKVNKSPDLESYDSSGLDTMLDELDIKTPPKTEDTPTLSPQDLVEEAADKLKKASTPTTTKSGSKATKSSVGKGGKRYPEETKPKVNKGAKNTETMTEVLTETILNKLEKVSDVNGESIKKVNPAELTKIVKSQFETLAPARVKHVVEQLTSRKSKLLGLDRPVLDKLVKHLVDVENATHYAAAGKKNASSILATKVKALNKFLTLQNI